MGSHFCWFYTIRTKKRLYIYHIHVYMCMLLDLACLVIAPRPPLSNTPFFLTSLTNFLPLSYPNRVTLFSWQFQLYNTWEIFFHVYLHIAMNDFLSHNKISMVHLHMISYSYVQWIISWRQQFIVFKIWKIYGAHMGPSQLLIRVRQKNFQTNHLD